MNGLFNDRKIYWSKFDITTILPDRKAIIDGVITFLLVLVGGILLMPLVGQLPMLGWDWYYYFNGNNVAFNINRPDSYFIPYTRYILSALTWLDWRTSLSLLNSITLVTVAISTWKMGGKYGSILLALTSPSLWMLLWLGHPEGLVLLGVITGFIPLTFIKPQVAFWSNLRSRKFLFWALIIIVFVLLIWTDWLPNSVLKSTVGIHWSQPSNFGWRDTGLPIALLGAILLVGAGKNPWLLMSAGCLISPDLMPYHIVILIPALGEIKGWKKTFVWFLSWLLVPGVGIGGTAKYLNFLFPLGIYWALNSWQNYHNNVRELFMNVKSAISEI